MSKKTKADKGPQESFRPGQISITQKGIALVEIRMAIKAMTKREAVENRRFICLKDNAGKMYTIDKDENKLLEGI